MNSPKLTDISQTHQISKDQQFFKLKTANKLDDPSDKEEAVQQPSSPVKRKMKKKTTVKEEKP